MKKFSNDDELSIYGPRLVSLRERIADAVLSTDEFTLNYHRFMFLNFFNFNKAVMHDCMHCLETGELERAKTMFKSMKPKFSKIIFMLKNKYDDQQLDQLVTDFYALIELYYNTYYNLIIKLINQHPQRKMYNFDDLMQRAYDAFLRTIALHNLSTKFTTLLGQNIIRMYQDMARELRNSIYANIDPNKNQKSMRVDFDVATIDRECHISIDDTINNNDMVATVMKLLDKKLQDNYLSNLEYAICKIALFEDFDSKEVGDKMGMDSHMISRAKHKAIVKLRKDGEFSNMMTEFKVKI
jgi:DNA-directed RNA polymerase specialized sigma subunit